MNCSVLDHLTVIFPPAIVWFISSSVCHLFSIFQGLGSSSFHLSFFFSICNCPIQFFLYLSLVSCLPQCHWAFMHPLFIPFLPFCHPNLSLFLLSPIVFLSCPATNRSFLYTSYTSPTHNLSFCYLLVYHPFLGVHLLCTITSFNPPCTSHLFPDAPHYSFFRAQTIHSTMYHQSLSPPYTCHSSS